MRPQPRPTDSDYSRVIPALRGRACVRFLPCAGTGGRAGCLPPLSGGQVPEGPEVLGAAATKRLWQKDSGAPMEPRFAANRDPNRLNVTTRFRLAAWANNHSTTTFCQWLAARLAAGGSPFARDSEALPQCIQ